MGRWDKNNGARKRRKGLRSSQQRQERSYAKIAKGFSEVEDDRYHLLTDEVESEIQRPESQNTELDWGDNHPETQVVVETRRDVPVANRTTGDPLIVCFRV